MYLWKQGPYKLRTFSTINITTFIAFLNDILQALSNSHIYLYAETLAFFINIRTLQKLKMFSSGICEYMQIICLQ